MYNAHSLTVFIIVGDQVFPKGIAAYQPSTGDSFVEGDVDTTQAKATIGITDIKVNRRGRLLSQMMGRRLSQSMTWHPVIFSTHSRTLDTCRRPK
jgi:hypothetical protein